MNKLHEEPKTTIIPELNFLQNGLYPKKLSIILKTNISGHTHMEYKSNMSLRNSNVDYTFFNQLIKLNESVVNDNTVYPNGIVPEVAYKNGVPHTIYTSTVPDTILQKFLNKDTFMKLLDALLKDKQQIVTLKDSCENDYINNNIRITLNTLFHDNNNFYIDNKPYKIVNYQWNEGDWHVSTVQLNKNLLQNALNPEKSINMTESEKDRNSKTIDQESKLLKEYIKNANINCIEGKQPVSAFSKFIATTFAPKKIGIAAEPDVLSIYNNTATKYDKSLSGTNEIKKTYQNAIDYVVGIIKSNEKNGQILSDLKNGCSRGIKELKIDTFQYIGYLCVPLRVIPEGEMYNIASNTLIGNILYPNNTLDFNISVGVNDLYNNLQETGLQLKQLLINNNKQIGYYMDDKVYSVIDKEYTKYKINATQSAEQLGKQAPDLNLDSSYMKIMTKIAESLDKMSSIIYKITDKKYKALNNNDIEYQIERIKTRLSMMREIKEFINNGNTLIAKNKEESKNTTFIKNIDALKKSVLQLFDLVNELNTSIDKVDKSKNKQQQPYIRNRTSSNDLKYIYDEITKLRSKFSKIPRNEDKSSSYESENTQTQIETNMLFQYNKLIFLLQKLRQDKKNNISQPDATIFTQNNSNKVDFIKLCKDVLFNSLKIMYLQREYIKKLYALYKLMYEVKRNEYYKILRSTGGNSNEQIENKIRINIVMQLFAFDMTIYQSILDSEFYRSDFGTIGPTMKQHILQLEKLELQISRYNIKDETDKNVADYDLELMIYTSYLYVILYNNIYFQFVTWEIFTEKTKYILCTFTQYVSKSIRSYSKLNNEYQGLFKPIDETGNKAPIIRNSETLSTVTKEQYETRLRSAASLCYDLVKIYSQLNTITYYREYELYKLSEKSNDSICQLSNYTIIMINNIYNINSNIDYPPQLLLTSPQKIMLDQYKQFSVEEWVIKQELSSYRQNTTKQEELLKRYKETLDLITPSLSKTSINKICLSLLDNKTCQPNVQLNDVRVINEYNICNFHSIIGPGSPFRNEDITAIFQEFIPTTHVVMIGGAPYGIGTSVIYTDPTNYKKYNAKIIAILKSINDIKLYTIQTNDGTKIYDISIRSIEPIPSQTVPSPSVQPINHVPSPSVQPIPPIPDDTYPDTPRSPLPPIPDDTYPDTPRSPLPSPSVQPINPVPPPSVQPINPIPGDTPPPPPRSPIPPIPDDTPPDTPRSPLPSHSVQPIIPVPPPRSSIPPIPDNTPPDTPRSPLPLPSLINPSIYSDSDTESTDNNVETPASDVETPASDDHGMRNALAYRDAIAPVDQTQVVVPAPIVPAPVDQTQVVIPAPIVPGVVPAPIVPAQVDQVQVVIPAVVPAPIVPVVVPAPIVPLQSKVIIFSYGGKEWENTVKNAIKWNAQLHKQTYDRWNKIETQNDKEQIEKTLKMMKIKVIEINYTDNNPIQQDNLYIIQNVDATQNSITLRCDDSNENIVSYDFGNNLGEYNNQRNDNNKLTNIFDNNTKIIPDHKYIVYPRIFIDYSSFDITNLDNIIFIVNHNNNFYNIYFSTQQTFIYDYKNINTKEFVDTQIFDKIPFYRIFPCKEINSNLIKYKEQIKPLDGSLFFNSFNSNIIIYEQNLRNGAVSRPSIRETIINTMRQIKDPLFRRIESYTDNESFPELLKKREGITIITIHKYTTDLPSLSTKLGNNVLKNNLGFYTLDEATNKIILIEQTSNPDTPADMDQTNTGYHYNYNTQYEKSEKLISDELFITTLLTNKIICPRIFIEYDTFDITTLSKLIFVIETHRADMSIENRSCLYIKNTKNTLTYDYSGNPRFVDNHIFEVIPFYKREYYEDVTHDILRSIANNQNVTKYFDKYKEIKNSLFFNSFFMENNIVVNDGTNIVYGGKKGSILRGGEPDSSDLIIENMKRKLGSKIDKFVGKKLIVPPAINVMKDKDNNLCYVIQVSLDLHEGSKDVTKKEKQVATCKNNHDKIVNAWKILTNQSGEAPLAVKEEKNVPASVVSNRLSVSMK